MPEFVEQLKFLQAMTPRSGTATLVREDGRWRMTEESTRDRDK